MVLLAFDDMKKTATMLEALQTLTQFMDKPPIERMFVCGSGHCTCSHVGSLYVAEFPKVQQQLTALDGNVSQATAAAEAAHEKIEVFLDHYNAAVRTISDAFVSFTHESACTVVQIDLLSQKLLFWNAKLTAWEAKLDERLRAKGK